MFEELLKLVTDNAQDAVINNQEVPNEQNEAVTQHVTSNIIDGLKSHAASGGVEDVMKLIGGGGGDLNTNPVMSSMSGGLIDSLMSKFGLSQGAAGNVISSMLPGIISKFVGQTNDPNNSSFDIAGIFSHLTGGQSNGFDIASIVKQVAGGGGAGGFDLSQITKMFGGGDQGSGDNSGAGGIMDGLKGLFGN